MIELEHMGLPFNRTPDGKIDQRRFGGHTRNYGEGPVRRSCFAADRTGHMILQTLYQQCLKHGVTFYDEYHVVDLLTEGGDLGDGGRAAGVVAYRIADGELHVLRSKAVMLATGGFGRMFRITSNAWTPDRRRRRAGLPPRRADAGHGVLPVPPDRDRRHRHPAVRGGPRRGRLPARQRRRSGSWSATRRSSWSSRRATWSAGPSYQEIRAGRGIDGKDYVHLDVRHLGRKVIEEKLPDITDFARVYQGVEPITEPVPIQPTAHYAMGGIPTDLLRAGHPRRGRTRSCPGCTRRASAACV